MGDPIGPSLIPLSKKGRYAVDDQPIRYDLLRIISDLYFDAPRF